MSILMDDIIWSILLIMYDYLFVLSLVAIDLQLQQLKKGEKIAISFSWRGHQAERALAFCSLETQVTLKPLTKSSYRCHLRCPNEDS